MIEIKKKSFYFVIELTLLALFIWFYVSHSLLLPDPSKTYSSFLPHHLQINAILNGHLLLSQHPFGYLRDFQFTDRGMMQGYGIGISLLTIPFECLARVFGSSPFPDRWVLLFYFTLMIIVLNFSLRLVLGTLGVAVYSWVGLLLRWYITIYILFCPGIGRLVQVHFWYFEYTIFYGVIFSAMLLSLFWICIQRPGKAIFLVLSLFAGFAWLIRPTLISYGLITFIIASIYIYQETRSIRLIIIGCACCSLGIFIDLWLNYLRSGSIWELGYSTSLTAAPANDYCFRFDYPFRQEHFLSATKELIGALFFNYTGQSPTYRWREETYVPFYGFHFILLLISAAFLIYFLSRILIRKAPFESRLPRPFFRMIFFTLIWGWLCLGTLFMFYLHYPNLCSRYLSDFSIAIGGISTALILLLFACFNKRENKTALALFFMIGASVFYICNKSFFEPDRRSFIEGNSNTDKKGLEGLLVSFNQGTLLDQKLPTEYYCGQPNFVAGLESQFTGWDISYSCKVAASTSIFLPAKKCITLNYSFIFKKEWPSVHVKRNTDYLELIHSQIAEPSRSNPLQEEITDQFCSKTPLSNAIALYTIGWVSPLELKDGSLPIRLDQVSVSDK